MHPTLSPGLPAFTSAVSQIASDRTWLITANRVYALTRDEASPNFQTCVGLASIVFARHRALPQHIEFLKPDGSVYLDAAKAEMFEWIRAERTRLRASISELAKGDPKL
jgi:hypothetical protein